MNKGVSKISLYLAVSIFSLVFFTNIALAGVIKIVEAKALSNGNGAYIEWRSEDDSQNLGFNIYRLERKKQIVLNKVLIAGSAIVTHDNLNSEITPYHYFDPYGSVNSQYIIESVSVNGENKILSQLSAKYDSTARLNLGENSKSLADIGRNEDGSYSIQYENPVAPSDKEFERLNSELIQNETTQKWIASQPGAKIAVKKDGLYRVNRAQLAATNFNINAPLENWQLYTDGIEQPIIVQPNGDYIEFYGRGVDTSSTDTKMYYLVVGTAPGRRIELNSRRLNATQVTVPNFQYVVTKKDRTVYAPQVINGDNEDNFWGPIIFSSSFTNISLDLRGIDTNAPFATINIKIRGLTTLPHSVRVRINNVELGTLSGDSRDLMQQQFSIPTSTLVEGNNVVSFVSLNGTNDLSLFDAVQVTYSRNFQANQNQLTLTSTNGRATRIQGFSSSNIRVFDISNPNGTMLVNAQIQVNSALIGASRPRILYAVSDEGILQPDSVTSNQPSNYLTTALNKDLIIISHSTFINQANALGDYRRSQGLTVSVVNVEDVFDESGFGASSGNAVKSFLQELNPHYALLFGDGTYDPRNYLRAATFSNFIPVKTFETLFGDAVSDDLYVDFNNDSLADLPIGRLPARDEATAQIIVNKILLFEQTVSTALTQRGATFISDTTDGWDFNASKQRLRNQLPSGIPADFIRRPDADAATVRQNIINKINSGRYLVVFSGHGSLSAWTSAEIFAVQYIPQLTNANNLNLLLPLNCLNGAFAHPTSNSLGEAMIRYANGGSVAAWSSSGETYPDTQELMALRFFQILGNSSFDRIGDAINASKQMTPDRDVRLSWILLGDPTLKLR